MPPNKSITVPKINGAQQRLAGNGGRVGQSCRPGQRRGWVLGGCPIVGDGGVGDVLPAGVGAVWTLWLLLATGCSR